MQHSYSPSINIKRDTQNERLYIPTENSKSVYETIASNFKSGVHSYNLIGSYGTGKSAFLLAFYKHLNKEEEYFKPLNGQFNGCQKFKFIQVVGQYESLVQSLGRELEVEPTEEAVYKKIKDLQTKYRKRKICLVLIIDEFGKTLEYASKNNPEKELYFIQKIAEYANDGKRNFLFLTTLHQNFDAYAIGLDEKDRKEWEKVKGRIKELPFNEPVEQLLQLASEGINKVYPAKAKKNISKTLLTQIKKTNLFKLRNELNDDVLNKLYPLEPLSASSLLISLQKYGQNERSLFGFIITKEPFGLAEFISSTKDDYYSLAHVFDYLVYNFSYLLQSRNNPDFFRWRVINTAIDRVDNLIEKNISESKNIIKSIGLLDLVHNNGASITKNFLKQYCKDVLKIKSADPILNQLEEKSIIKYHSFKTSYSIYEGSDIDIEAEIEQKRKEVGQIISLEEEINKYFELDYVVAKAVSYKSGTPRLFKYEITESPIIDFIEESSEIDGIINIVISDKAKPSYLKSKLTEPIIHCIIDQNENLKNQLNEIALVDKVLIENTLDKVARAELFEFKSSLINKVISSFRSYLYSSSANWYFEGKKIKIENSKQLNKRLSTIISIVYPDTPIFKNELINKSKISGSIHHAKKQFIQAIVNFSNKPNFNFDDNKMPPERTIYHSLLENTGLHTNNADSAYFSNPTDTSFKALWDISQEFLKSTRKGKRTIQEFISTLQKRPFKLKDGFIEFWTITFFFIHKEEFALYEDGVYTPNFNTEVAELFFKRAKSFSIKGIKVSGVRLNLFNKYRALIQQGSHETLTNKGFQEIAKPFLVFYKQLSNYSKHSTKYLSKDAINFRATLLNAKELEKTFFEDIPKCFGYTISIIEKDKNLLGKFADKVQDSIKELRLYDDKLIERIKGVLEFYLGLENLSFDELKNGFINKYQGKLDHLLNPKQRTIIRRLESQIPDEKLWISSIVQVLIGKTIANFNDDDELLLYESIKKEFDDLEALLDLTKDNFDVNKEVGIKYKIIGTDKRNKEKQIVLSRKDQREIKKLQEKINKLVGGYSEKVIEGLYLEMLKNL